MLVILFVLAGAAAAVSAATTCRDGDEGGHNLPRGGAVPQDIHPASRERQVSPRHSVIGL